MTISITASVKFIIGAQTYAEGSTYDVADDIAHHAIRRGWATGNGAVGNKSVTMIRSWREGTTVYDADSTYTINHPLADAMIAYGVATAAPDAASDALALVSAGEWTANVVQSGGAYLDAVPVKPGDANYSAYYGYPDGTTVPLVSPPDWAFGSPYWDADSDALWTAGMGGHANGVQNGIYKFDPKTVKFTQTQVSGRVSQSEDSGAPFQSSDGNGWRSWPRDPTQTTDRSANLGAGNRGPISGHGYGHLCKSGTGELMSYTAAAFNGGTGTPGGAWFVGTAKGQWKQGANDAWSAADGALPVDVNCLSLYMPDYGSVREVIWRYGSTLAPQAYSLKRDLTSYKAHQKFDVAPVSHHGAVIPDPDNAGFLAYLALLSDGASGIDRTKLCLANKIDADDGVTRNWVATAALPANVPTNVDNSSTWLWMGGTSRKVAIFTAVNGGTQIEVWSYDLDTMAFTLEVAATGSPNPQSSSWAELWKRVWLDASRGAFGLVTGSSVEAMGDAIYYLKKPAGL